VGDGGYRRIRARPRRDCAQRGSFAWALRDDFHLDD